MLDRIGLLDKVRSTAHKVPAIEVFSASRIRFEIPGLYMTLKRAQLDLFLIEHACQERAKGKVTFAHAEISKVKTGNNGSYAELHYSELSEPILARITVLATGGRGALPYSQGLVSSEKPSAMAYRGYVLSSYKQENMAISYDRSILPGYVWVIPLGRDSSGSWLYNVGYGTSYRFKNNGKLHLKKTLETFLSEFPLTRLLLKKGEDLFGTKSAPLRCGLTDSGPIQKNNLIAIGETIGTTFPFTGEGIGKAMESGRIAAEIIHDALASGDMSRLSRYPSALNSRIKPRYSGYIKAEKWLSHRWLNDFVVRRISKSRFLQERLQEFMSETGDPRTLFSVTSLLQSYWK